MKTIDVEVGKNTVPAFVSSTNLHQKIKSLQMTTILETTDLEGKNSPLASSKPCGINEKKKIAHRRKSSFESPSRQNANSPNIDLKVAVGFSSPYLSTIPRINGQGGIVPSDA